MLTAKVFSLTLELRHLFQLKNRRWNYIIEDLRMSDTALSTRRYLVRLNSSHLDSEASMPLTRPTLVTSNILTHHRILLKLALFIALAEAGSYH
jgi:hypothetical protein